MVHRENPENYFGGNQVSWDDILKAVVVVGFFVVCFLALRRKK